MYKDFRELIIYAKSCNFFVHLDTNALSLQAEDIPLFTAYVDLLGLPLDGSNPSVHGAMRKSRMHFDRVVKAATESVGAGINLKINSVIGQHNIKDLWKLAELIRFIRPKIWSIYEFWPVGDRAAANADRYIVPEDEFQSNVQGLVSIMDGIKVELGLVKDRHRSYFFVDDTGEAYTLDPVDRNLYISIGSIFDSSVLDRWHQAGTLSANAARWEKRFQIVSN